jgi:hypothetical protein
MSEVKKRLECLGAEMLPKSYYEVLNNHDMKENLDKATCNRSILLDEKWPLKMDVFFYNMVFL